MQNLKSVFTTGESMLGLGGGVERLSDIKNLSAD